MKNTKAYIIGSIALVVGFVILFELNKDFLLLWNCNNISISTEKPLTKDNVKIEYGFSVNTINRKNDLDLFEKREKYTILYEGGKKRNEIKNEYGENDFLITYNNKYYFSFRQFKLNRRHQHNYNFTFYQKEKKIFLLVEIKGKDNMKFERPMIEMKFANKYRCNVPVDSAGIIYNMIELTDTDKK
jgi:hypothetical protein